MVLYAAWLDTPQGRMLSIGDAEALYLLEFIERRRPARISHTFSEQIAPLLAEIPSKHSEDSVHATRPRYAWKEDRPTECASCQRKCKKCGLEYEVAKLCNKTQSVIVPGWTPALRSIERELGEYFNGSHNPFQTPLAVDGSPFQREVWRELLKIPPGETRTYTDIAQSIGRPKAARAVANAIGANHLAIVIPCHRVIMANGKLGGYAGGILRKQELLRLERLRSL